MRKLVKEFKEFISRGNVIDMAVGIIIGSAFTAIVNSLVSDIFTPLIGFLTGGINFESLKFSFGEGDSAAVLRYGSFISAVINFVIIAIVVFVLIKIINRLRNLKGHEAEKEKKQTCPYCISKIDMKATRCPHCTSVIEGSENKKDHAAQ